MPEVHQTIGRDKRTIVLKNYVDGSLTDATTVLLSDPGGTYGIRRMDDYTASVADGTAFTKEATGHYEYDFDPPALGVEYEAQIEVTQTSGNVDRWTHEIKVRGVVDANEPYVTRANLTEQVPWIDDLLAPLHGQNDFRAQRSSARRWLDGIILAHADHNQTVREWLQGGRLFIDEQVLLACSYRALSQIMQANLNGGEVYDRLAEQFRGDADNEVNSMVALFDCDLDGCPDARVSLRAARAIRA